MRVKSERIPEIGDKFCCYTDDHEVLTTDGWISIKDITNKHKVASLNDGTLTYVNPIETMSYDCDDELYVVNTNHISMKVTKNHRVWVGNRNGKNFKVKLAEDIYRKRVTFLKNCDDYKPDYTDIPKELKLNKEETEITHFVLPDGQELDIEAWCTFFGIWIAEGCTLRDYAVSIATHKKRVKLALEEANKKLKFTLNKHKDKKNDTIKNAWCYRSGKLVDYIKVLSVGATKKYLPEWVWYLNKKQALILLEGMECGDGHTIKMEKQLDMIHQVLN